MHNYAGFSDKDNEIPLLAFFAAHAPAPSEEYISMQMRCDKNRNPHNDDPRFPLRDRHEIEIDYKLMYAATMIKRGKF